MRLVIAIATLTTLTTAAPRHPTRPAPVEVIRRAIDAVGGEAALRGLRTIITEGASTNRSPGQEDLPFGAPAASMAFTRTTRDRAGKRLRSDAEARFTGNSGPSAHTTAIATQDAAMFMTNGRRIVGPRNFQQAGVTTLDNFMPLVLLKMLDQPDSVSTAVPLRIAGQTAEAVTFVSNGVPATIYFDSATGLPLQQVTVADDPILGDAITTVTWSHWTTSAVRLPGQTYSAGARGTVISIQRVVSINDPIDDTTFAIPDSIAAQFRAQPAAAATPNGQLVTLTQLAPGVWRAAGPGYNSMVVEQPDRLVLVEAPVSANWTQALLDTLAARFPGKRIGWAVNTHHHWDHSGGVRTVLAAGIPVVTQERNVAFIRSIGAAHKTVKPDALSRGRRMPQVIGVTDSLTLGSGDLRVEVLSISTAQDGGAHVVAYVPGPGILFESDVLSVPPGNHPTLGKPSAAEIVKIARDRGLTVTQVVGGHGEVATMDDITRAAQ